MNDNQMDASDIENYMKDIKNLFLNGSNEFESIPPIADSQIQFLRNFVPSSDKFKKCS